MPPQQLRKLAIFAAILRFVINSTFTLCSRSFFFYQENTFLIAAGLIFIAGLLVDAAGTTGPPWAAVATSPLLVEFYFGSIIAFLFLAGFSLPPGIAIVAIVLSVAGILVLGEPTDLNWHRVLSWGLPCAVLLASAVSLQRIGIRVPKIFVALSASSSSLYLVHLSLFRLLGKLGQ